jgi:hypothetical protein
MECGQQCRHVRGGNRVLKWQKREKEISKWNFQVNLDRANLRSERLESVAPRRDKNNEQFFFFSVQQFFFKS